MAQIFIMRHGAVENPDGVLYGTLPGFHLSELGQAQTKEAGDFMGQFALDKIITSSLERAVETGQMVGAKQSQAIEYLVDDRLIDANFGIYVGTDVADFDSKRSHYLQLQLEGKDGLEHPQSVADRMTAVVSEWADRFPANNLLFVSHGDPIAFYLASLTDADLVPAATVQYPKKASVYEIDLARKQWQEIFTPTNSQF